MPFVEIELPRAVLLCEQPPLQPVRELRRRVLQRDELLIEHRAQPCEFVGLAQIFGAHHLVELRRECLIVDVHPDAAVSRPARCSAPRPDRSRCRDPTCPCRLPSASSTFRRRRLRRPSNRRRARRLPDSHRNPNRTIRRPSRCPGRFRPSSGGSSYSGRQARDPTESRATARLKRSWSSIHSFSASISLPARSSTNSRQMPDDVFRGRRQLATGQVSRAPAAQPPR